MFKEKTIRPYFAHCTLLELFLNYSKNMIRHSSEVICSKAVAMDSKGFFSIALYVAMIAVLGRVMFTPRYGEVRESLDLEYDYIIGMAWDTSLIQVLGDPLY